jgi:hypothetical protein
MNFDVHFSVLALYVFVYRYEQSALWLMMLDLRLLPVAESAPSWLLSLADHCAMMNMHRNEKGNPLITISTVYAVYNMWRLLVL